MFIKEKGLKIYNNNKVIFQNFTYITFLQLFLLLTPLFTYPYLVRILGRELYGLVITAQVVASYCSLFVDFGFKSISARDISIHRDNKDKLSEILCSILSIRFLIWIFSLIAYMGVIFLVPEYKTHLLLFICAFGLTFNELLFPQFFFQGIEKMKYISILNISLRSMFVVFIFLFVRRPEQYYFVPLFTSIGNFLGGVVSLYIIFKKEKIKWFIPQWSSMKIYLKDASPIFATDLICSIKDKFSYILLGSIMGMSDVVIYDLGAKFNSILTRPMGIIGIVLFPKIAKERNIRLFKKTALYSFIGVVLIVIVVNIFLPQLASFFLDGEISSLLPLRLFLIVPAVLSISGFIASNLLIALGYNIYILYSIIITTIVYLGMLAIFYFSGALNSVTSFVVIALVSYVAEFIYRLFKSFRVFRDEAAAKAELLKLQNNL